LIRTTTLLCLGFALAMPVLASKQNIEQQKANTIRYFAKLAGVISPMLEYTPRGEVNAQQAKTLNHYRVIYDEQGRFQEMRFYQGEKASSNSYFGAHRVTYKYDNNQHSRNYFDENDQPSIMWRHYYQGGDVHKEVYSRSGNTTELSIYNQFGEQIAVATDSYQFIAVSLDAKRFIQRQLKQDGSANIIFDYLPFEVSMITKDVNDHLYQIINLDPDTLKRSENAKAGFAEMRLNFDQYGNELGWGFRNEQGNLVNRPNAGVDGGYATWQYQMKWKNRALGLFNSFSEFYRKSDNTPFCKPSGVCSIVTYRDDWGNLLGWEYLDKNGELIVNPDDDYAKLLIERDSTGYRHSVKYFDANGLLRESGVAETRYHMDDNGKEIEIRFDAKGKKIET
jgi:hypothetical protein